MGMRMRMLKPFLMIVGLLFGVCLFFFGGYDDSPGAQFLGLVIVVSCIVGIVRHCRNRTN